MPLQFYHGEAILTEEYERYRRSQAARWLEHVRGLGNRIRTLQAEIEAQRDIASGVQAVRYDGAPSRRATSRSSARRTRPYRGFEDQSTAKL